MADESPGRHSHSILSVLIASLNTSFSESVDILSTVNWLSYPSLFRWLISYQGFGQPRICLLTAEVVKYWLKKKKPKFFTEVKANLLNLIELSAKHCSTASTRSLNLKGKASSHTLMWLPDGKLVSLPSKKIQETSETIGYG